ncbi:MAG TPA: response regulator [Candidatus Acidoferrales bacterium]|nr:response regulator [Candidatus Acidoferrales bacterium]
MMEESKNFLGRARAVEALQCRTNPPARILVVDDEPDIRRLTAEVLKSFGYQVDTAEDGMAGWKALRAVCHAPESYALLITDYDMPGLTGLALVKKLRAAHLALPVIMATGRLLPEDLLTRYAWLQPMAALIKPYSVEQLLEAVEANLRTANGAREQMASPPKRLSAGGLRF